MKAMKIVLPIVMIAVLCLAWFSFATGTLSEFTAYRACLKDAEISIDAGLYEQAVEFYKESLGYKSLESTYMEIKAAYDLLYTEEHTPFIRNLYVEDMALAAEAFPKTELFWTTQIKLYNEANNFTKAYSVAKKAQNYGVHGDELDSLYQELLYKVKVDYSLYTSFKTALNGFITVSDGANWFVLDDSGNTITSNYQFAGLLNDEGKGLYTNSVDTRFLDMNEVPRARFDITVEDAGYYNEKSDILPVKMNGVWKYLKLDGSFLPGEFEVAGSFYDRQAVVMTGGTWSVIDEEGKLKALTGFEDIKLDMYGCHIQNGIVIAKKDGEYHLYDTEFNQIGNFGAEDIDICIDPEKIAFMNNGKWGFVDSNGKVVREPEFAGAKSFANGYAAVCNDQSLWGFIKEDYTLVVDYQFADAFYFTQAETCMVSKTTGTVQMLHFMFE